MNLVYVDNHDNVIGSGTKANAVEHGIAVRVSRIFLFNNKHELLLQKRSATVSWPGLWDQSAAGHVDEGEDYPQAAVRELQEEMGIENVALRQVAHYYTEETDEEHVKKRFNVLFIGDYDGEVRIDENEVADYRWVSISRLTEEMKQSPHNFTEGFIHSLKVFLQP